MIGQIFKIFTMKIHVKYKNGLAIDQIEHNDESIKDMIEQKKYPEYQIFNWSLGKEKYICSYNNDEIESNEDIF